MTGQPVRATPDGSTWFVTIPANEDHRVTVSLEQDGSTLGEFSFHWVDLDGEPCPCPRLEAYQDGWGALLQCGVLTYMALWKEDISIDAVVSALQVLGYTVRDRRVPAT